MGGLQGYPGLLSVPGTGSRFNYLGMKNQPSHARTSFSHRPLPGQRRGAAALGCHQRTAGSGKEGLGPAHSSEELCKDIPQAKRASLHPQGMSGRAEAGTLAGLSLPEVPSF